MPFRLPGDIPLRKIQQMLRRAGAEMERQRGNHQRWIREVNGKVLCTVLQADDPVRRDVYEGVRRQPGISKRQWIRLYTDRKYRLASTGTSINLGR